MTGFNAYFNNYLETKHNENVKRYRKEVLDAMVDLFEAYKTRCEVDIKFYGKRLDWKITKARMNILLTEEDLSKLELEAKKLTK